jgi:4'-phosphopantetheinyl transferase EntD
MMDRLLPPEVSIVAALGDEPGAVLFPEEEALIEGAVAQRVAEFATGRHCARQALRRIGMADAPILRGDKREPIWPLGIVGSITHCSGFRAAAVAPATAARTIGHDAEPHAAIGERVARRVLDDAERAWIAAAPSGTHWDRLIFSAKESVYKAWYPLTGCFLDFDEARVAVDPAASTFTARLLVEPPVGVPARFAGRYLVEGGLVITAIAVLR